MNNNNFKKLLASKLAEREKNLSPSLTIWVRSLEQGETEVKNKHHKVVL